ncbi:MAG TPA: SIMPL domain-containing protein [Noviherbaspirillum sp.]|jgi:predicted secreted protein|nr:SIMPL domain-containing protein [Noviherbaspirillum sp.]
MLNFDAYARSEVPNDEMLVNLAVERKGADIGALNEAVIGAMRSIISEAKAVPAVNSKLGHISTNPNYVNNAQDGWVVRGDVVLDSNDMKALGQLAGRLGRDHQISGVSFRLSENARRMEESALLPQAAANFKRKAAEAANAFGFKNYQIKQITLNRPGEFRHIVNYGTVVPASTSAIPAARGNTEVIVTVTGVASMK